MLHLYKDYSLVSKSEQKILAQYLFSTYAVCKNVF